MIAIGGAIAYFTKTTVNPTTGEKQRVALNEQQEMTLGLQSAPQMAREMGGAVDPKDPRAQLVTEVGMKVMRNSLAAKSPYANNFHYILLSDPKTVNAFALPGGQVFITWGLLQKLTNEAELAGVLGHETGHVIERHSAQQMAKESTGPIAGHGGRRRFQRQSRQRDEFRDDCQLCQPDEATQLQSRR